MTQKDFADHHGIGVGNLGRCIPAKLTFSSFNRVDPGNPGNPLSVQMRPLTAGYGG